MADPKKKEKEKAEGIMTKIESEDEYTENTVKDDPNARIVKDSKV